MTKRRLFCMRDSVPVRIRQASTAIETPGILPLVRWGAHHFIRQDESCFTSQTNSSGTVDRVQVRALDADSDTKHEV